MRYVIIGASAAGAQAAQELRVLDPASTITVISEERSLPYSRCLISRFVDGRLGENNLLFKTAGFFAEYGIESKLGARVTAIDRGAHRLTLDSAEPLSYDRLLLATGSRPSKPAIPGIDRRGVFMFHSLADARAVKETAVPGSSVVVVGAGFAGLEAAYALQRIGCKVTVVERCSQILPNQLDREGGNIIREDLAQIGIEIIFDQSVAAIEGAGGAVESVVLANNTRLACIAVVFATGIRPNKELAQACGLTTDRGVIVDDYMQTSDPDIFAAGDVIEIADIASGKRVLSATWINAVLQGRYAAYNMAGKRRRYAEGVGIQNAVQFHRVPAISFGQTTVDADNQDEYDVMSHRSGTVYRKLVLRQGRVVGMIFVGDIAKSGFYAALIRSGVDIREFRQRLLDDDFSHAVFARSHAFNQYDPYRDTTPNWDGNGWWVERAKAIAR